MHNLNNTVQAQRSAVTGKLRDSLYSSGTSLSRLSETPFAFWLSVTALRCACTVLLKLSLFEAFSNQYGHSRQ